MRPRDAALVVSLVLCATPAATAKDIRPGDLRVCNHTRCVTITDRYVLRLFASFYYGAIGETEVVDEYTARMHLKQPYAPLLNTPATPARRATMATNTTVVITVRRRFRRRW